MNVKVWTTEEKVSGSVSPVVVSALAGFKGHLEGLRRDVQDAAGSGRLTFELRRRILAQARSIEEMTLSAVAGHIVSEAAAVRSDLERLFHQAEFAEAGAVIVSSTHGAACNGYVWLRRADGVVEVQLALSDKDCAPVGSQRSLWSERSFDAAYSWFEAHRAEVAAELGALSASYIEGAA